MVSGEFTKSEDNDGDISCKKEVVLEAGTQIKDKERMVRLMRALRYTRVLACSPGTWSPPVSAPICICMRILGVVSAAAALLCLARRVDDSGSLTCCQR